MENKLSYLKGIEDAADQDITKAHHTTAICLEFDSPLAKIMGDHEQAEKFLNELNAEIQKIKDIKELSALVQLIEEDQREISPIRLSAEMQSRLARSAFSIYSRSTVDAGIVKKLFNSPYFDNKIKYARRKILDIEEGKEDEGTFLTELQKQKKISKINNASVWGLYFAILIWLAISWPEEANLFEVVSKSVIVTILAFIVTKPLSTHLVSRITEGKHPNLLSYIRSNDEQENEFQYMNALVSVQKKIDKMHQQFLRIQKDFEDVKDDIDEQKKVESLTEMAIILKATKEITSKVQNVLQQYEEEKSYPIKPNHKSKAKLKKDREKWQKRKAKNLSKNKSSKRIKKKKKKDEERMRLAEEEKEHQRLEQKEALVGNLEKLLEDISKD